MNRMTKFLITLALIGVAGVVGYRGLGQLCEPANLEGSGHKDAHENAAPSTAEVSLAERVCRSSPISALLESVGARPMTHVAAPATHKDDHASDTPSPSTHEHEEGEEEGAVRLSQEDIRKLGIQTQTAGEGAVTLHIERPAEVKFNRDRLAHIVPRVPGVVSRVEVSQGTHVGEGQLLAILESRELADAKADYLAAVERRDLARQAFLREERLWKQNVSAEREYLSAKTALAEAEISVATAQQKLRALGLSEAVIKTLSRDDPRLTEYKITAPLAGTVVERHLSLGEAVGTERAVFIVADVSTVWVDVTIYPSDLSSVKPGQRILIDLDEGEPISGTIEFVTPEVKEETRTGVARLVVDNASGRLRPGMFVTAQVQISQEQAPVRVPKEAVQRQDNANVVYVKHNGSFEPRPVKLGRENHEFVEIVAGLRPGETYVSKGGFTIKSLMQKSQMGEGHAH